MNFFDSSYKDALKTAVMGKINEENTGNQVKTMIYIILLIIFCSCCAMCIYNGFDFQKIFSSFNINILLSTNCLTIIAVLLAMIYGFHSVSKDPSTLSKYLPSAFTGNSITPTLPNLSATMPLSAQNIPNILGTSSDVLSSYASTPLLNTNI